MKRSAPLKRTPMKRRRRRARPGKDDAAYLDWIRQRRCCSCGAIPPSHAHHITGAGMGQKADDRDTIPLCGICHRELHEFSGKFRFFSREVRLTWQQGQIARFRAMHERDTSPTPIAF